MPMTAKMTSARSRSKNLFQVLFTYIKSTQVDSTYYIACQVQYISQLYPEDINLTSDINS